MTEQKRIAHIREQTEWYSSQRCRTTTGRFEVVTEDRYAYLLAPEMVGTAIALIGQVVRLTFTGWPAPYVCAIEQCEDGAEPIDDDVRTCEQVYPKGSRHD